MSFANKVVIGLGALVPSSRWKVWLYRRLGFQIGPHTRIRGRSFIYARRAKLGEGVVIEPRTRVVCDELIMGDEAKIDSETIVFGAGALEMGRGSYIGPRAWINCEARITLGDETGVGPGSAIYTHGVWLPYVEGYPRKFEPVVLEDGVWVPGNVTIQPGVRIGRGSMVGAGSVVTKDVPPDSFAAGAPASVVSPMARIRQSLDSEQVADRVLEILEGFLALAASQGMQVVRGTGESLAQGSGRGLRGSSFRLIFLRGTVSPATARNLVGGSGRAETLLVAAGGIPDDLLPILDQDPRLAWFDIPGRRARAVWRGTAYELRRYFGSHYGTRFRLVP